MRLRRRNRDEDQDRPVSRRLLRLRSRRFWLMVLPTCAMGAILLLWLAPAIVAHTGLKQKIVSAALADFEGSVTVGSASLGWLSPVLARDIQAFDTQGQPLARVKSVSSEKWLLALLSDKSHPGGFRVEEPTARLALRDDGSNWEDALKKLLAAPSQGTSPEDFTLEVIGGTLEVHDQTARREWRVEDLNLAVKLSAKDAVPWKANVKGELQDGTRAPSSISAELAWQPHQMPATGMGEGQLTVKTDALNLDAISSAARRFLGDVQAEGTLACEGVWQWSESAGRTRLQIDRLAAQNVALRAPAWLGEDVVRTAFLRSSGQVVTEGERWRFDKLAVDTEFGKLQARGEVRAERIMSAEFWTGLTRRLPAEDIHVEGQLDLVRLARMLPSTLNLRQNIQLQSGTVNVSLTSTSGDPPKLSGRLEATDLKAVDQGREFVWQKPILLNADVRQSAQGLVVDELTCQSSSFDLSGQGTLSEGSVTLRGDLGQLASEAGRFVDLTAYRLAGRVEGDVRWKQSAGKQIAADGHLKLREFELLSPSSTPWREPLLSVDFAARAEADAGRVTRVASGSATLKSGGDVLEAELTEPVEGPTAASAWPVRLRVNGNLATWLPRLQPVVATNGWQLAGDVNIDAAASVAASKIDAPSVSVQVESFRAVGADMVIDEPAIRFDTKASWDTAQRRLTAEETTMSSSTVAFRARQVVLQLPAQGASVSGNLSYRADMGRLVRWFQTAGQAADQQFTGSLTGTARASHDLGITSIDWDSTAENVVYATREAAGPRATAASSAAWQQAWKVMTLKLTGRQRYDHRRDLLQVDELTAASEMLHLTANGKVEQCSLQRQADLTGEIDYELAWLTEKLRPLLGPHVQFVGREKGHFSVNGPLQWPGSLSPGTQPAPAPGPAVALTSATVSGGGLATTPARPPVGLLASTTPVPASLVPPGLSGAADFGWQSANIYGLLLGKGGLNASLSRGILQFAPLQIPVSEGRIHALPRLDLNVTPVRLELDKGPFVENVRISPELCDTWLKYVAPVVADATRAEGRFSVALDGAKVPLTQPRTSDARGQLTIHTGQIGPGPLAQQFIGLAQQVKAVVDGRPATGNSGSSSPWVILPEQTVAFQVKDGRVHHEGWVANVGDVTIRTTGSVGFDETVAIVAEIPVRDEWVAGKRYLAAMKGTTLRVPVQGSLSQPRVDSRALGNLSGQVIRDSAGRLIEDEVTRGLQRLLGPQR